jgi:hypothetical protein
MRAEPAAAAPAEIVVDSIHAHNHLRAQFDTQQRNYHQMYSLARALESLRQKGVRHEELRQGELNDEVLRGRSVLVINLPSMDLPPYMVPEIAAIRRFVESGGGLLFITDHSNCYLHGWKLKPLLGELGIGVLTETACDVPPHVMGDGAGWLRVTHFVDHPVTRGVRVAGMQTAGTVDDALAIATTSDQAWGDQWTAPLVDQPLAVGYYGNWKFDEGERRGRLAVMGVKELGRGRIVIIADQNLWGDVFLTYADNARLWFNSMAWLLGRSGEDAQRWAAEFRASRWPRIACYESPDGPLFGSTDSDGYFHLFAHLQRRIWTVAGSDVSGEWSLLIFAQDASLPASDLALVLRHLRAGRPILLLNDAGFAFQAGNGLSGQLREALGEPASDQTVGAMRVVRFGDKAQVLLLLDPATWTNARLPQPTKEPDSVQQVQQRRIDAVIDACVAAAGAQGSAGN